MLLRMTDTVVARCNCVIGASAVCGGVVGSDLGKDVLFTQLDDVDSLYRFLLCLAARSGQCWVDIRSGDIPVRELRIIKM